MSASAPNYLNTTLYVGNLHYAVTEGILFDKFSRAGPVMSIRVCRNAITRRSLGYAYVNFQEPAGAEYAMKTMNFELIMGRPIRIMWSQRDPSLRKNGVGKIFIKNLENSIDSLALSNMFSRFGNIHSFKDQQPNLAPKITGMLLYLENSEVLQLLESSESLHGKVDEAVAVLAFWASKAAAAGLANKTPQDVHTTGEHKPKQQNISPPPQGTKQQPAVPVPDQEPLTVSHLANLSPEDREQILGQHLYSLILGQLPDLARKITGTLLQLEDSKILKLLEAPESLHTKVGHRLYRLIQDRQPDLVPKITGMLLELENFKVLQLLEASESLHGKVDEAVAVLAFWASEAAAAGLANKTPQDDHTTGEQKPEQPNIRPPLHASPGPHTPVHYTIYKNSAVKETVTYLTAVG
ncbi:hypothetical protein SKAU_G00292930 [Synaphobranchus kaupii]|uniref:Uncharacterized protein n=1 Tax=Synaphobranchus kaupii TaxID=118154 RepID=A0A9Q1IKC8_SYNKA|nr:hypothetical protein SKAU_G00292930 [Synaphobranchus kaupii]